MNKTEQDAKNRILDARTGCLVEASDTYVVALRAQLIYWAADLDAELAARRHMVAQRDESDEMLMRRAARGNS